MIIRIHEITPGKTIFRAEEGFDVISVPMEYFVYELAEEIVTAHFLAVPPAMPPQEVLDILKGRMSVNDSALVTTTVQATVVGNAVEIKVPTGAEVISELVEGLVAIPVGPADVVIMPANAFQPMLPGWNDGQYFGIEGTTFIPACFDLEAGLFMFGAHPTSEEVLTELAVANLIRFGYLDPVVTDIEVATFKQFDMSEDVTVSATWETLKEISFEAANMSPFHAWALLMAEVRGEGDMLHVTEEGVKYLTYKPGEVVYPEPTEEELHPPQPGLDENGNLLPGYHYDEAGRVVADTEEVTE